MLFACAFKYFCCPSKQVMQKKLFYFIFIFSFVIQGFSQTGEVITVMSYNLANYRNSTQQCTNSTNSPSAKEQNLNTIVKYVKPDILVCQEIGGASAQPVDQLLVNALNINGVNYYGKANYSNNSFSNLVNMVYFNSNKLGLISQKSIIKDLSGQNLVRVIDLYRFYYKDSLLTALSDTVYITVIGAHLKAGTGNSNATQRANATAALMNYIKINKTDDNIIMCGDFNTYKSQEVCYQNLTNTGNSNLNFYDPINKPGAWNNNANFAIIHTQSTRVSGQTNSGCFSSGGLDDRFDHIIASNAIINNLDGIKYITGTYKSVGNDGFHFNKSIKSGTNNSVPSSILNAIYDLSDHLPVVMDIEISKMGLSLDEDALRSTELRFENPAKEKIELQLRKNSRAKNCVVTDMQGRVVAQQKFKTQGNALTCNINISALQAGVYILQVVTDRGHSVQQKFIIY